MDVLGNLRPSQRLYNGIQIRLRLEDWPDTLPLRAGSTIVGIGENHQELVYPIWRFVLESDATIEVLGGWFKVPCSLDQLVAWYLTEMEKMGWVKSKSFREGNSAGINFQSPDQKIHVEISILDRPDLGDSTAMIRRVVKQPWARVNKGNPTGTLRSGTGAKSRTPRAAQTAARTPKVKKRRVLHKARQRVVA